jgi:hypothetical protein
VLNMIFRNIRDKLDMRGKILLLVIVTLIDSCISVGITLATSSTTISFQNIFGPTTVKKKKIILKF